MNLAFTGYYGNGNLGDEAFVAVLRDRFPDATFTAGVFSGEETHVVVGGGEFEIWMVKDAPQTANLYAVGIGLVRDAIGPDRAEWLRKFHFVGTRDLQSHQLALAWGIRSRCFADLAYLLTPSSQRVETARGDTVVVPRMMIDPWPIIDSMGLDNVTFLPFHPYDVQGIPRCTPLIDIQAPRQGLEVICRASLVLCWGKLHPKVFAHSQGIPWFDAAPDVKGLAFLQMAQNTKEFLKSQAEQSIQELKERLDK